MQTGWGWGAFILPHLEQTAIYNQIDFNLGTLVGRRFRLGAVVCRGRRLCEPCAHLDRVNGGGVLRPLVHRGGLRADVVDGGTLRVGDRLVVE